MQAVWGRKSSAFYLLPGNRSTNQPNCLPPTHLSKDPQTLHAQDSVTPALQWTEEVESLTCRDPFSALVPHCCSTRGAVRVQHCLLQCRGSQRVGCRTGVAGMGNSMQLHNLLLPEFLVFEVAVWLWELCGVCEEVFNRKIKTPVSTYTLGELQATHSFWTFCEQSCQGA